MKRRAGFYYLALSFLSLTGIVAVKAYAGETNLPPLLPSVRLVINLLYVNLAAAFFLQIKNLDPEQATRRASWILLAGVGALLCSMPPVFSGDLMEYLIRGRMLGIYHRSPYQHVPREFPNDLLYPYSIWLDNPDSYGPLWVWMETLPVLVFPDSIRGMIWLQKFLLLGGISAGVYFFAEILKVFKWEGQAKTLALFAYNPLLWVTALVDGRNDTMMLALTLASFYFLIKKRFTTSFMFWTLAFLVKYTVVIILPFFVIFAVKEEAKRLGKFPALFILKQCVLNTGLIIAMFWPLWGGWGTFLALTKASSWFYTNTIPYAVQQALSLAGIQMSAAALKNGFLAAYGVFYAWALWAAVRETGFEPRRVVRFFSLIYVLFYLTVTIPFGFHYLLWALPWLVLARWPQEDVLITLYSFAGLFSYFKRINYLLILATALYFGFLFTQRSRAK